MGRLDSVHRGKEMFKPNYYFARTTSCEEAKCQKHLTTWSNDKK